MDESDFQTPPESPTLIANEEEDDIFNHISTLPSLKKGSPVDRDDTLLASATTKLQLEFSTLFTKIRLSLQKLKVSTESILSHFRTMKFIGPNLEPVYTSQKDTFYSTVSKPIYSMEDLFPAIAPYCSWFNHLLVENIIETFCDDDDKLQQSWEKFKKKFAKYCEARLHKCPLDQFGEDHPSADTSPVVMKIDCRWKTVKVKQLTVIRDAVSQVLAIDPYNLYLRAVQNGCIELLFYVPYSVAHRFVQPSVEQIIGLQQHRILQIRCDPSLLKSDRLVCQNNDSETELGNVEEQEAVNSTGLGVFSKLLDIAQYLSKSAADAYKQYVNSSATHGHQLFSFGGHLRNIGDEFQLRLRIVPIARRFRNLGDRFQARLFTPIIVRYAPLLPVLAALMLYKDLPQSLNSVVLGISFTGSGLLLVFNSVEKGF